MRSGQSKGRIIAMQYLLVQQDGNAVGPHDASSCTGILSIGGLSHFRLTLLTVKGTHEDLFIYISYDHPSSSIADC